MFENAKNALDHMILHIQYHNDSPPSPEPGARTQTPIFGWLASQRSRFTKRPLYCATHPELRQNSLVERHLGDTASVAMRQRLWGAVAAAHSDSFRQNLLQLGRRASRDQRSYQRQSVVVKVRLQRAVTQPFTGASIPRCKTAEK